MKKTAAFIGLGLAGGGLALHEGLPGFGPREHHARALDAAVAACSQEVRQAMQACDTDPVSVNGASSEGPGAELRPCLESNGASTVYLVCHKDGLSVSRALYIGGK